MLVIATSAVALALSRAETTAVMAVLFVGSEVAVYGVLTRLFSDPR